MVPPAATHFALRELQAKAKALSASHGHAGGAGADGLQRHAEALAGGVVGPHCRGAGFRQRLRVGGNGH